MIENIQDFLKLKSLVSLGLDTNGEYAKALDKYSKENNIEICPACEVVIHNKTVVYFSYGKPGTIERLRARVCNYAKKPGCINRCKSISTEENLKEGYTDLHPPFLSNEDINKIVDELLPNDFV